jgi:phospholipid/cholesterol/gamma-HCH transport system substrate-binding protein
MKLPSINLRGASGKGVFNGRDPFRIGIAAILGLALLGVFIVVISTVSFGSRSYTAQLPHTAGLRVGESVQVAGVDSGEVRGIELEGKRVVVHFTVDRSIRLGRDTTAAVKVSTLLGTHYLDIDPQGTGELRDDLVPLAQTSVPFNLQDVIDKGTAAANKLDSALLGQALSTVADTLRASGPEFLPALEGVDRISRVVSERTDQFGRLLTSSREVADQLAQSSDDLIRLMRQTNLVVDELLRRREAIHRLLLDVRTLAVSVRGIIADTKQDIGPALDNFDKVLKILKGKDDELRAALHKLAVAGRYLANAAGNGPWIELLIPGQADDLYCNTGSGCR